MYAIAAVSSLLLAVVAPAESAALNNPNFVPGHDVIVHLFEWKWMDIADECETYLGPKGFGGVQVSPMQENAMISQRPWWERYQTISYRWVTRSGNDLEFRNMVKRCNTAGVRIYVDVIFNHMSGDWPNITGTGGSMADSYNRQYYGVPYGPNDFHSMCAINNYENAHEIRECELLGLHDLNQKSEYVRGKIVDFLNAAIEAGVAGFRIDAAKHMWPEDLGVIYSRLRDLNTDHGFPSNARPYVYQEVIDMGGEAISKSEYSGLAAVTEFKFGVEIGKAFNGNTPLMYFKSFGESWGLLPSNNALVFIDNHDTQRSHGPEGSILTHKRPKLYKMAVAFMLAYPYGQAKLMSSFSFNNSDQGPPTENESNIKSPIIQNDGTCDSDWVCEHRWQEISNMVRFRVATNNTAISEWWDNGNNQIAFSLGDAGFVAFNVDHTDLKTRLHTKLQAGKYCDVISGNVENGTCTGKTVSVDESGNAYVEILQNEDEGVLAIHRNAKL